MKGGRCEVFTSINKGSFSPCDYDISKEQWPRPPYKVGTTEVTLTVTDSEGNTDTCTADVKVRGVGKCKEDQNKKPVARCKDKFRKAKNFPACDVYTSIDNGSFDPDGDNIRKKQQPPPPYEADKTTKVTLTVTDSKGAKDSCTGEVTVRGVGKCDPKNKRPVAKCKDANVVANNPGNGCKADASIDDWSYDPDGDHLSISQKPEGPYPVGTTHVKLIVKDPDGATDTCFADVTVRAGPKCQEPDNKPPVAKCKDADVEAWDIANGCVADASIDNGSMTLTAIISAYLSSLKGLTRLAPPRM